MNSKRMLVVSWFDEDDRAREKVIWLHHGHFNLARQYGLECYAAADNPEGALGTISSALSEYGSFKVLTVCGHGNYYKAGVKLRENQLWDGSGCNLSQVELLLMVSCSIGRLNQTRDLDVEGFCVQLAIHKAPAMLACRWPVSCFEACAFANEIVHQHLRLREEFPGREVHTECLRARALNAARKTFLGGSAYLATQSSVGLNTAAAFELYGLG